MSTPTEITQHDIHVMAEQIVRLRAIERAAWHALELAREGRAVDAYAVLSDALDVVSAKGATS